MGWSSKRQQLQAYIAGIIDGEGSLGIYKATPPKKMLKGVVTVSMTEPHAVVLIKALYPESTLCFRKPTNYPNAKMQYTLQLNGNFAYQFLRDIKPFLIVKQRQCRLMLAWIVHCRRTHKSFGAVTLTCSHCNNYAAVIKAAKSNPINAVNLVELLTKHELRQYQAKREEATQLISTMGTLLEGLETKHRISQSVEATSAAEQDIVQISPTI